MKLENGHFSFSRFLFFQLSTTLARKVMKRPPAFIIYFQNLPQIVALYQLSLSEYFFQNNTSSFNLDPQKILDTKTERHQKMSNLCTFFAETKIFERPTFYGNQNMDKDLLDPKSSHMSPTNISSYSYAKCQFFSTFLLFLLLITATPTYEFRVK